MIDKTGFLASIMEQIKADSIDAEVVLGLSNIRPFNLHPEKWFEGYLVKSTQILIECCHNMIFLGYSLAFSWFSSTYESQLF